MADFPLPSAAGVVKRVAGIDQAANTEITDTVPAAANEVQSISGTPSATFSLSADGFTGPVSLSTTATAQNVQDYLNAFPQYNYGSGAVVCSGGPLPSAITITYSGAPKAGQNVSQPAVANGATGITISTTTQGTQSKSWLLLSASVSLAQGATQTPNPTLIIDDGSNVVFQSTPLASAINAGVTAQVTWAPGVALSGGGAATVCTIPIPYGLVLPTGYRIRTSTAGIGANTNYAAPSYLVVELG